MDINLLLSASLHKGIGTEKLKLINEKMLCNPDLSLFEIFEKITQDTGRVICDYNRESVLKSMNESERLSDKMERNGIKIIQILPDYPLIFAKGNISLTDSLFKAGVVGTRKPYDYINELTEFISYEISASGYPVVSGLACGSDTAAHKGALKGYGSTIAVLPSGILSVYPYENMELAERIAESGLLISQFHPDFKIRKYSAVSRNHLIALLSNVLILTQSGLNGGSVYAVNSCIKAGKPVIPFRFTGDGFGLNEKLENDLSLWDVI